LLLAKWSFIAAQILMLFLTNGVLLEMYLLAYGAPLYKLYYERNVLAAQQG
jgi:hypothetical protein